ncbi:MAG: hypothetical protein IPK10_11580 [Bacteroidetes bacterium]|nr:hypothetical protein [Bacteroidota bacterium]
MANQATVQIRFLMTDVINGLAGRYGWLLDDICVTGAPCELVDPTAGAPYPGQTLWVGDIYNNLGPFDVWVWANDASGIAHPFVGPGFAEMFYSVNGAPFQSELMFNIFDSAFAATIPAGNANDTICWYFEAYDNSGCNNMVRHPAVGEYCFILKGPITFPYCDNFEIAGTLWNPDPNSSGSLWTNAPPSGPDLNTAHSLLMYGVLVILEA